MLVDTCRPVYFVFSGSLQAEALGGVECLAPSLHLQLLVPSHLGASKERRFDSIAGEVTKHSASSSSNTHHLVFLKPSLFLPQNTTLSVTDCYDFTLTACKISEISCDTNLPQLCQIHSPVSCSRLWRCNHCYFVNDVIRGFVKTGAWQFL